MEEPFDKKCMALGEMETSRYSDADVDDFLADVFGSEELWWSEDEL